MATEDPHAAPAAGSGYETRDADVRGLAAFGLGLVALIGLVLLVLWMFFVPLVQSRIPPTPAEPPTNLANQLRALRRNEDRVLNTYEWVDRKAGVVRIPIERAMELVAERGVPAGKGPKTEVEVQAEKGKRP